MHATTGSKPGLPQRDHVGVPLDDAPPGPRARSPHVPCRGRRRPRPCERARTRACSRTWPSAGRPRAGAGPGSRRRGRARRRAGRAGGAEVVAAARPREARLAQLFARESLLGRLPRNQVAAERQPEAELAADLLVRGRAPSGSRGPCRRPPCPRACARRTPRPGRAARTAARAGGALRPAAGTSPRIRAGPGTVPRATRPHRRNRDPGSPGRRDHVALRAAAEAVEELVGGVHREATACAPRETGSGR